MAAIRGAVGRAGTMKAVVLHAFGGPEQLQYEDVPIPQPAADEVLMRVRAVSVNRTFDLRVREDGNGRQPILPLVLGADAAGDAVAVGPNVRDFQVGDRGAIWRAVTCGICKACRANDADNCQQKRMIGIHRWGGYAEYVAVPEFSLCKLPDGLGYADATYVIRHFPTAIALAHGRAGLRAGETVLVMAAAGALGAALVQVARRAGARVIVAAGADARVAAAREFGAFAGVNYRSQDLAAEVLKLTEGRGVDVVFENIGDPTLWPGAFNSLAYEGRLATVGAHGGAAVPLDVRRLYGRHLSVLGGVSTRRADLDEALAGAGAGDFKAFIGATLPLEKAAQAHRMVADRAVTGKVILVPPGAGEPAA